MTELKPCPNPWCESTDVGIESDSYDSPPVHYAACNACGNTGPARDTEEGAADVWNPRHNEAEELLEWFAAFDTAEIQRRENDWLVYDYEGDLGKGQTPLDALRAAREASDE